MFRLTHQMVRGFAADPQPLATVEDLADIEVAIGMPLPVPYREFVTQYGFVVFGLDEDRRCIFDCRYDHPGQMVVRRGDIAFLHDAPRILLSWRTLTSGPVADDDSLPAFPVDYLPVGNSAGQSQILLELRPLLGRVWYWRETEWRWGTGDNTELGFVADNFYDFVNNLQSDSL